MAAYEPLMNASQPNFRRSMSDFACSGPGYAMPLSIYPITRRQVHAGTFMLAKRPGHAFPGRLHIYYAPSFIFYETFTG